MRKSGFFKTLFLLGLPFLLSQCGWQEQGFGDESKVGGKMVVISAFLEQPSATKTSLSPERKVSWCAGDQIRVYNASHPEGVVYTLEAASAGSQEGQFSGEDLSGSGPFYAIYPESAGGSLIGQKISVTLPLKQTYAEDSFGSGAAVSMALSQQLSSLQFKNVLGGVALNVTSEKAISGIRLQTKGDEALCGRCQ